METNYQVSCQGNGEASYQLIAKFPTGMVSRTDVMADGFEPVYNSQE